MFYNVLDFGAAGDGKTLDSPAIQRAIDAVKASGKPGTVVIPAGDYRCGSILCCSDLTIRLEPAQAPFTATALPSGIAITATVRRLKHLLTLRTKIM